MGSSTVPGTKQGLLSTRNCGQDKIKINGDQICSGATSVAYFSQQIQRVNSLEL